jgi:hypothetical protein
LGAAPILAVESVAKQETSRALFGAGESASTSPFTRRNEHKFNKIMSNWRVLRMKRSSDEHCASNAFIADVKRSKIELKFIMKQETVQTMKNSTSQAGVMSAECWTAMAEAANLGTTQ